MQKSILLSGIAPSGVMHIAPDLYMTKYRVDIMNHNSMIKI